MKIYTGIGSRETSLAIIEKMSYIAQHFANLGWILRSGGADGADLAFENGCNQVNGKKEIYLPWKGFNNSTSLLYTPSQNAFILASTIHPAWNKLSYGAKKLHARNCHQVLGKTLDMPSDLVICWTKDGKEIGGTRTVLILAKQYNIPIVNLALQDIDFSAFY